MPSFSRKSLRQALAYQMNDLVLGTITHSWTNVGGDIRFYDWTKSDTSLSGSDPYAGAYINLTGSLLRNGGDCRVASFVEAGFPNTYFLSVQYAGPTSPPSGHEYEVHSLMKSYLKDLALDDAIKRTRVAREVSVPSVDGAHFYDLDTALSGMRVVRVMDAWAYTNPNGSLDRGKAGLINWEVAATGSGLEMRIEPSLGASQSLVLNAVLEMTLPMNDLATVDVPDERMILYAAEVYAWNLLSKQSPGSQVQAYIAHRDTAARELSRLAALYKSSVARSIQQGSADPC